MKSHSFCFEKRELWLFSIDITDEVMYNVTKKYADAGALRSIIADSFAHDMEG